MSWMSKALETYEANSHFAGKIREGEEPLLPIAHMVFKVQMEITIDQDGQFITASVLNPKNCSTLIPVTEDSGGRTSGIAPHPLNDTLAFIAADFGKYSQTDNHNKYNAYMKGLKRWCSSDYSHPKVEAVLAYVSKGKVIEDLVQAGCLELTADGWLANKKINNTEYGKVLVRFNVMDARHPEAVSATWEDNQLMSDYIDYYTSIMSGKKDICYLTGKKAVIEQNHPKGIVAAKYGAKLLSSNDKSNFTFLGRFTEASEASVVSYVASQKAHAALSWLSRRQGVVIGRQDKRTYICWTSKGKRIEPFHKNLEFFEHEDSDDGPQTSEEYKEKIRKAFLGYEKELEDVHSDVSIIGLDAATTGRLSVTYYSELKGSDLLERIYYWENSCRWYYHNKTGKSIIKTPNICQIVRCTFGTEQGNSIELDDRFFKAQVERMVSCLIERSPLPYDLIHALYIKATSPELYKKWWNRENVLSTSCALTAKYYNEKYKTVEKEKGEKYTMKLDEDIRDTSYLFGRLFAYLEKAERDVLNEKGDKRETNALRLQFAFVSHPLFTWKVIESALIPYYQQMDPEKERKYKNDIAEIVKKLYESFEGDINKAKTQLNRPLKETYLLGYYLQREKLYSSKEKGAITDENTGKQN